MPWHNAKRAIDWTPAAGERHTVRTALVLKALIEPTNAGQAGLPASTKAPSAVTSLVRHTTLRCDL